MPAGKIAASWLIWLVSFLLVCGICAAAGFYIDQSLLENVEAKYGPEARRRFEAWQQLMANAANTDDDLEKLRRANDFFNQNTEFVDDAILWRQNDYWAAPTEFLAKGAGDCEDYSIAKYFTLLAMGLDESKLRITYVKALELNQAHMVLTYFSNPRAVPLVLDNLNPIIKPATQRRDLLPVYSFNGSGLWLAKSKGSGQHVGGSDRLSLWNDLKQRMLDNPF